MFQNAALRLYRALESVQPPSAAAFFRLAAAQIRRELLDLARRYSGTPVADSAYRDSPRVGKVAPPLSGLDPADSTRDPGRLSFWTDFHNAVELLPAEEREVFDLVFYQGLPQEEAASILDISIRTLKRRWQSARLELARAVGGELPGL